MLGTSKRTVSQDDRFSEDNGQRDRMCQPGKSPTSNGKRATLETAPNQTRCRLAALARRNKRTTRLARARIKRLLAPASKRIGMAADAKCETAVAKGNVMSRFLSLCVTNQL